MTYYDISATDQTFNEYTSLADNNSTMNFFIGTLHSDVDLNDNEYFRIRAYSNNEKEELIYNSSFQMDYCSR